MVVPAVVPAVLVQVQELPAKEITAEQDLEPVVAVVAVLAVLVVLELAAQVVLAYIQQ